MPRKPRGPLTPVTVEVPPVIVERLGRLARHHNVTPGQIVAWAVGNQHFAPLRVGDRVIVKQNARDLDGPWRGVVKGYREQGGGAALYVALDGLGERWVLEKMCEPESP